MSEEKFKCVLCDYTTETKYCYQKHLLTKKHTAKIIEATNNANTKKKLKFVCEYCNYEFSQSSNLTRHQNECTKKTNLKNELLSAKKEQMKEIKIFKMIFIITSSFSLINTNSAL